ncbi:10082_t:CDS:2 [Acaulospora colombiana]|uniref:10082_t:CDS:1 n=1 Tax=Acaulospora colombiana TaxID=27376 RepID=A0ACA9KZF8_9GLOM|nr:10082_t:CDS:2 [Acaulospora colombiana]
MAARGGINAKGEAVPQPVKVQRYWPGKAPEGVDEYSSEEEEEEQLEQFEKENAELITNVQKVNISEKDVATDRRLRRLREAKETSYSEGVDRRRRYYEEQNVVKESKPEIDYEAKEQVGEEEDIILRRQRIRERALEQRRQEEERLKALEESYKAQLSPQEEEKEESEEETSEYETDSEDEDQNSRKLLKPVFIPKAHRETILERERTEKLAEEAEAKRLKELEERRKESHIMVAEVVQRESQKEVEEGVAHEVDDTDGIDEQTEYEEWKLRELKRIKRDREEREAREKERAEIERRRNMPEEQRLAEDLERIKKQNEEKPKGQYKFLQKYYHKGAFYLDSEDNIFKRNYTAPTPDEAAHKELLPKVMQVKNFGRAGQTKWTHLVDQDTSKKDTAWNQKSLVNKSIISKMGGMHGGFDKPTSKKRKTG